MKLAVVAAECSLRDMNDDGEDAAIADGQAILCIFSPYLGPANR